MHHSSSASSPASFIALSDAMRREARRRRWGRRVWLGVGLLLLIWANVGWMVTRPEHFAAPTAVTVTGDLGNWFAFNGIVLFLALCWMGSRNPWLERSFGLDVLLLGHRRLAMAVLGCLAGHALFRSWSISMDMGVGFDVSLLYRMRLSEWPLTLGRVAFFAMLLCAGLAYAGQALGWLRFRHWKRPHLLFYLLFPAGMLHGMWWGNDMGRHPLVDLWWTLMALFAVDAVLRLGYVRRVRPRLRWRLEARQREADHTATIVLAPEIPEGWTPSPRLPGQFGVLRVPAQAGMPGMNEPHPFTFSGSAVPVQTPLQCTIKEAGNFTRSALRLPLGTHFMVEGPYGTFLDDIWSCQRLALLAGGVGVTPFLSLLRSWAAAGEALPAVLLWSNKHRADVFAVGELAALCRQLPLTVVHCLSRAPREQVDQIPAQPGMHWISGRLDAAVLERWLQGNEGCYACGPEDWLDGVLTSLRRAHGIPAHRVRREHFFW